MVSTDDDPNGNLAGTFGGLENGLTGDSGGYRHDYVDLTPYAGQTIQLRLRYLTDPAFEERGWFADDFSVTADGTEVCSDDVEGGLNGWTAEDGTLAGTTGAGWVQTSGAFDYEQYYIAEWRNLDGYDKGLNTPYTTVYQVGDGVEGEADAVQRARSADLAAGRVELVQRHQQQPVRPAEHRLARAPCCWSTRTTSRRG